MAIITYPLNNVEYTAEDAELYHSTRTSGVFANDDFPITVSGEGNAVTIGEGIGWIRNSKFSGKVVANKAEMSLDLGLPHATYPRIDAVVLQFNANANASEIIVKNGTAKTDPMPPEVVRTESIYELHLYHVHREAGAASVTASNVTDLRSDADYCGIMYDDVTPGADTMSSSIYDPTGEVAAAGGIQEYIAANAAGKEEIFLTIITKNTDGTYSADHTYAEIKAASAANKCCLCKQGHILMPLRGQFSYSDVGNYYQFVSTPVVGTGYIVFFNVMESGSVQFVERFVPLHDNQSKRGTVTNFTATSDAITDLSCTVDWELDGRIVAAQLKLSCTNTSNSLSSIRLDGPYGSMPGTVDTKTWFMANMTEGTNPEYIVNFFSQSSSSFRMRPSLLIARRDGGTIGSSISFRVQFAYYAAQSIT